MSRLLVALVSLSLLQFGGAERSDVVNALSTVLADRYVDEAVGKRVAEVLRAKLARAEFDTLTQPEAFAAALTDVLQRETHDRHLWVWYREGAAIRLRDEGRGQAGLGGKGSLRTPRLLHLCVV